MEKSCEPPRRPGRGLLPEALAEALRGPLAGQAGIRVVEIGLGRRFTYVVGEDGSLGIAYAPQDEPLPSWLVEGEHSYGDIVGYAWSHPVLTSAALAAANAATASLVDNEGLEALDATAGGDIAAAVIERGVRVAALVGFVPGVAARLRRLGVEVVVYENSAMHRREAEKNGFQAYPGQQLVVDMDSFDYIVATGSSLIDPLLVYAARRGGKPMALVGPTSSFHPAAAARLGADQLGGSYVPPENRGKLLRLVKAGQGFRRIKSLVVKWLWRRRL